MFKKIFIFVVMLAAAPLLMPSPAAQAVNGNDFPFGNIIDDVVFTDKDSMTVAEIQQFLESKVVGGSCDRNRPTYNNNYNPPWTCLFEFQQNPITGVNNYGQFESSGQPSSVPGGKTAAEIIWQAGQDHDINPQVLIVLLQKEQGLVTDNWPWTVQYSKATGYLCPDTAPCDSTQADFYKQVDGAARLFRFYLDNLDRYWYSIGQNDILYNPNQACGRKTINIENAATVALYLYTPYTPNQAALNNLYGTGDSCSAYGNRNFWRFFNDWFGSTQVSTPYAWQQESIEFFYDSERTQQITNGIVSFTPGSTVYATLKAKNTGYQIWDDTTFKLGTWSARDRTSRYQGSDWLSFKRLALLEEGSVGSGEIGTFNFSLTAPDTPGERVEIFNIVDEGQSWLSGDLLQIPVQTVDIKNVASSTAHTLTKGMSITKGEHIISPDGYSTLIFSDSGRIELYNRFEKSWQPVSASVNNERLSMQYDGNLVVYDDTNTPLWASNTGGNPDAYMVLDTDGDLKVLSSSDVVLWSSQTGSLPDGLSFALRNIKSGDRLHRGQTLENSLRTYRLTMQYDGNLVLYRQSDNKPLWASNTKDSQIEHVRLQYDGNLVIYRRDGTAAWSTRTNGSGNTRLVLQYDGNVVIYRNSDNRAVWTTKR